MYKITFIHKNETKEYVLYEPANDDLCLAKAQLTLEMGKSGELKLGIPSVNVERGNIVCLTDEVIVYRDGNEIFRGRPVTQQNDFYVTGELTCEGILSYLYDTYYPPFDFSGKPNDLLKDVIDNHNSFVESRKQFRVGNVTVKDPNDYIARSSDTYNRTITLLSEKFVGDSLGGYFHVRVENGIKYLDYLSSYGTSASQKVELGSNILDISTEVEYGDIITAVLPLGYKTSETDEDGNQTSSYVTVESVNNGDLYVRDEALIQRYGFICACVEWQDVTDPGNLLSKARAYLAQNSITIETITVKAVDLSIAEAETQPFKLGDSVQVISKPHGIDQIIELSSMQLDLLNPANDQLTFGETGTSLVGGISNEERNVADSLNNLTMVVGKISSDYITTKNLTAEIAKLGYVKADELEAKVGEFGFLKTNELESEVSKFGYMTVVEADLKYTTIEQADIIEANIVKVAGDLADYKVVIAGDFTAVNAEVESLKAKDTEIENALIGKASVGELEAVSTRTGLLESDLSKLNTLVNGNLTSDNIQSLVISGEKFTVADGFIKNAMIESMTFDKITGIDINTTNLTVHSEDGKSTWSDNTIQISDENRVRVQIGEDAAGDYNMYLWDAFGNMLWNATGVTENGLNDGIIKDVAIADDAGINSLKINYQSINQALTEQGVTLSSTTIMLDDKNQTLDVAFNTMTTTIVNNLAEAKTYADDKADTALSDAKSYADGKASTTLTSAQQYALNQANSALASAKSYADTSASNTLASAQSDATAKANSALASAKTYADSAVDGIEIGGRNLALSTKEFGSPWTNTPISHDVVYTDETTGIKYRKIWHNTTTSWANFITQHIDFEPNAEYTVSLLVRKNTDINPRLNIRNDRDGAYTYFYLSKEITSREWTRIKTTAVTHPDSGNEPFRIYAYFTSEGGNDAGGALDAASAIDVALVKIEKGNKATDWTPAPEDTEAEITNLTEITTTQSTQISTMQGQITALITEDTNIKGDYNALVSRYNATVAEVDSIKTTIGEHTTLIDANTDEIVAVKARATTIETDLNGIRTRVSANETAIGKKADGTTVDALTTRVATAESTLDGFEASLTATNKTVSDNYTELKAYTDTAKASAISTAASDATTKANSAFGNASLLAEMANGELLYKDPTFLDGLNSVNRYTRTAYASYLTLTRIASPSDCPTKSGYCVEIKATGAITNDIFCQGFYQTIQSRANAHFIIKYLIKLPVGYTLSAASNQMGTGFTDKWLTSRVGTGTWQTYIREVKCGSTGTFSTGGHVYVSGSPTPTADAPLTWYLGAIYAYDITQASTVQNQIDATNVTVATHTETLSSHDIRITANENAISLKVSTADFNSYKTTVTGQISTAKNEAISTAASDATTKANNAQSAAISAAASDATTKANNALSSAKSDAATKANNALASAKSYTDAEITVVNESLTTTNQEISVMKGQIALKVEQTDIDTAVANVVIGGRNYALDSATEKSNTRSTANVSCTYKISDAFQKLTGVTSFTISADLKSANVSSDFKVDMYLRTSSSVASTPNAFAWVPGTQYKRFSATVRLNSAYSPSDIVYVYVRAYGGTGTVYAKNIKVEIGNKATDWTPAPEDVDASITAVDNKFASYSTTTQMQSAITAAKNEINLSVSQTYATKNNVTGIESRLSTAEGTITAHASEIALMVKESDVTGNYLVGKINLSSTTATIAAKHINLAGAVTISMLATDTKTQLDTATSNASTALTNAATAQSTADTAKANAATAQSTANTANARATYHYGTCATAAGTAAKVGTLSGFVLYTGAKVSIKFTNANTVANPTLNINSTGAKTIRANGANLTASSKYNWRAGSIVNFVYDGTYWVMEESTANYLWASNSDVTKIDGGNIYTGSIKAAQIDVDDLFAQNITAAGTIIGATLSGELIQGATIEAAVIQNVGNGSFTFSDNIGKVGVTITDGGIEVFNRNLGNNARMTTNGVVEADTVRTTAGVNLDELDTKVNGKQNALSTASSGVYKKYGNVVVMRLFNARPGNVPSGYRPAQSQSVHVIWSNGSSFYMGWIVVNTDGTLTYSYIRDDHSYNTPASTFNPYGIGIWLI